MTDDDDVGGGPRSLAADRVYSGPGSAQDSARRTIADPDASDTDRAEALATLGRTAYYDNRISEAIRYLEAAMQLRLSEDLRSEVSLILAPALSKRGRSVEALELLDDLEPGRAMEIQAKALNQRGAILVEIGRLAEAFESFERAAEIQQRLGDVGGEGRARLNMGAAASEMGDQSRAEACYERAWLLNLQSGQRVMCAMIEGNLGYVSSRKGDFSSALEWYRRGRKSFAQLGDVDLLVAVLETDHATTLLDVGLNHEAYEAAESARASSVAGDNVVQEAQALLLRGEAELRLGQFAAAETTLEKVGLLATEIGTESLRLRSDYLRQRLRFAEGRLHPDPEATIELAEGLHAAAWNREAFRALVFGARALFDAGDRSKAARILAFSDHLRDDWVDPIDRAYASALSAMIAGNTVRFDLALRAGEDEIDRQRQLLSAAELETRLGHRTRDLRELAIRRPAAVGDPVAILETHDRMFVSRFEQRQASRSNRYLRGQLRDVRVGLQEAQLKGSPVDQLRRRAAELEQRILDSTRDQGNEVGTVPLSGLLSRSGAPTLVTFFDHRSRLFAITSGDEISLHDLGSVETLKQMRRAQRTGLRRLAAGDDRVRDRVEATGERLETLLFAPLDIPNDRPLAIVPHGAFTGIAWAGIPHLRTRRFLVTPSVRSALTPTSPMRVESIGLLSGGRLDFARAEIDAIAEIWADLSPTVKHEASTDDARITLESSDLVHFATHGTFRSDNPFLSALHFNNGDLTLIDLDHQESLPRLVVLASCDSGTRTEIGTEQVGTTDVLLSLGVQAVIASALIVDDAAAGRVTVDLHDALARGETVVEAMGWARTRALTRNEATDLAAAATFTVHGSAAAFAPVEYAKIEV